MATDREALTDIADLIVRDCCELDPADTEHPSTLCIRAEDLQMILHVHLAPPAAALAAPPVEQQAAAMVVCKNCRGGGYRLHERGGKVVRIECDRCGGAGKMSPFPFEQPAPQAGAADRPNPMSREQIRSVLMAHGYTVKPGQTDLKPYVYEAAEELICLGRELLDAHHTEQPSQDAEDAARYRWLREQHWNEADFCVVRDPRRAVRLGHDCPSLERLDAAIDAARAAQALGEKGSA